MDDDVTIEMRTDVTYEASDSFGGVVFVHCDTIREALEGRIDAGIIRRLRNEIAHGLLLRFADRLDNGQQRVPHDILRVRALFCGPF
jgi:hypothetical protein